MTHVQDGEDAVNHKWYT